MTTGEVNELEQSSFPLHRAVFSNDVKELVELLKSHSVDEKDVHGNTPLMIAVMLGHKECIALLLAHNAPVKVKNLQGWSPLAEAISYGDRQAIPLVSRILPSDICKIHKKGSKLRMDTTLIDFNEKNWERGDVSFVYDSAGTASRNLVVLDNKAKVFQWVRYEENQDEVEDEVDILMANDIVSAQMSTRAISFARAQSGWFFRQDKSEMIGAFSADFYTLEGLVLVSRKRREHLSQDDIAKNKAFLSNLQAGSVAGSDEQAVHRASLPPPPRTTVSWEEYIAAEHGNPPVLGRPQLLKRNVKNFKATVAMSEDFPLTVQQLLNMLEVIAPFKHLRKLRDFCSFKLPDGFPVKVEIPLFPTISAKITFQQFTFLNDIPDKLFVVPSTYREDCTRFADL